MDSPPLTLPLHNRRSLSRVKSGWNAVQPSDNTSSNRTGQDGRDSEATTRTPVSSGQVAMSQVYAAMSSMSKSIRGRDGAVSQQAEVEEQLPSSSSSSSGLKKGEDAAVEFSKKRDE